MNEPIIKPNQPGKKVSMGSKLGINNSSQSGVMSTAEFTSYKDFVLQLSKYKVDYEILYNRLAVPIEYCPFPKTMTTLNVFDAEGGTMKQKTVEAEDLLHCPEEVSLRVVAIHYFSELTSNVVDKVCLKMDIPPYFLLQHFTSSYRIAKPPLLPPSQAVSLEIGLHDPHRFSAMILKSEGSHSKPIGILYFCFTLNFTQEVTVFILSTKGPMEHNTHRDIVHAPGPKTYMLNKLKFNLVHDNWFQDFETSLYQMTAEDINSALRNPYEIPALFAESLLRYYYFQFGTYRRNLNAIVSSNRENLRGNKHAIFEPASIGDKELTTLEYNLKSMQNMGSACDDIAPRLSHFQHYENYDSTKIKKLCKSYQELRDQIKSTGEDVSAYCQLISSVIATEAAQESIAEAQSVKKLTQMATIFLPLTFSTAVYGMNVPELENSTLRTFIITSVVAIVSSLVFLWLLRRPWKRMLLPILWLLNFILSNRTKK